MAGLLGAAVLVAAVVVVVLAVLLARQRSASGALRRELEELQAHAERQVRSEVARRIKQEETRLTKEAEARRQELSRREQEVAKRHTDLSEQRVKLEELAASLDAKAENLTERSGQLDARSRELEARAQSVDQVLAAARAKLEQIAGLTTEQARKQVLDDAEKEVRGDVARMIQRADESARRDAEEKAREALLAAMTQVRAATISDGTITVVTLPSDEMKGRVIGREGRNIRAIEQATGVDVLVDETPRTILLAAWDPERRAIAARSLRKLVEDGRIHPARIEEVVEKTRAELDEESRERGEQACHELALSGVHDRLMLALGRLDFVRDHGQQLLQRAKEVAQIAGALGEELRVNPEALRRAGLLHEVARAEKQPLSTHWAIASADLVTRFGEQPPVAQAIRALASAPDAPRIALGVLLNTARRISLSRPGGRNDNLQRFLDRQREIESLALAREGVQTALAVRAGRELRVHLRADAVADDDAIIIARELALAIEQRVDYPGQVRVTVVRETRAVSFAV